MKAMVKITALFMILQSSAILADVYHQHRTYEQVGYCRYCDRNSYRENQNSIRWNDDFANEWPRYGVTNQGKVGFADVSEQPLISGFERGVYNTPK